MKYSELNISEICNILVNSIIEEFNKLEKNHITNVKLIDLGEFMVLKGTTTINNPLNYTNLFIEKIKSLFSYERHINVIDLIIYNHKVDLNEVNLYLTFGLNQSFRKDNMIHVSDDLYGKSLHSDKLFHIYLKYVWYNLSHTYFINDITFKLKSENKNIFDIRWDNIDFEIDSKNCMVSTKWVESLILDLFDFNPFHIIKHLSLDEYNFENELLSNNRCWEMRDKVSEIITV